MILTFLLVHSYEGTGRSLSIKLLQQLRSQATPIGSNTNDKAGQNAITGRFLKEVSYYIIVINLCFNNSTQLL